MSVDFGNLKVPRIIPQQIPRDKLYTVNTMPLYIAPASAPAAKSLQSCLTLCDPIDLSPPGSPVPGILQARTLEWVAISFSNASRPLDTKLYILSRESCGLA